MDLLLRRRMMMLQKGGGRDTDGYASDGLIFRLDGIRRGDNIGHWTDIVSGIKFQISDDRWVADGATFNNSPIQGDKDLNDVILTVELVLNPSGTKSRYAEIINSDYLSVKNQYNYLYFRREGRTPYNAVENVDILGKTSVTYVIGKYAYSNGIQKEIGSSVTRPSPSVEGVFMVGGAPNITSNNYVGEIQAIRLYNRELTVDEVMSNLAIDNDRFNLGLTLN